MKKLMYVNRHPCIWLCGALISSSLAGCVGKSNPNVDSGSPKVLQVELEPSTPSYKDLFSRVEVIQLESDPQSLIGYIDRTVCIGDSIVIFDMSRFAILLFSPDGKFLNSIGQRGDGPEDYLMCYDVAYDRSNQSVSVLEPRGILNEYSTDGRFLTKLQLPSKSNYMACEWMRPGELALWSAVNEDEYGVTVVDVKSEKTVFEDWKRDRMLDMQRMQPFYRFHDEVKFCPPLTNDVYALTDTCLRLDYKWEFTPANISDAYLNEIATIEKPLEKNQRLINDFKNGVLKNVPTFNGETDEFYYVSLQTGIGDDAGYLSVFHDKNQDNSIVMHHFKEGMTVHPIFMNEDFMLCHIPYDEVDIYNNVFGLDFTCEEDENPLLAKFFFKK